MSNEMTSDIYRLYESFYSTTDINVKRFIFSKFSCLIKIFPSCTFINEMYYNLLKYTERNYRQLEYLNERDKQKTQNFIKANEEYIEDLVPFGKKIQNETSFVEVPAYYLDMILDSFFQYISPVLNEFYHRMNREGRILINNINCLPLNTNDKKHVHNGFVDYLSVNEPKCYIYLNSYNSFMDMAILAHEMGHAYYSYVNDINFNDFSDNNQIIKLEIPSKMLEILLVRYLKEIGYFKEARSIMNVFNKRITEDRNYKNRMSKLKYSIGGFIGSQYADLINNYSIEDIFHHIFLTDFRNLLDTSDKHFEDGFTEVIPSYSLLKTYSKVF